jgi:pSer/pThr/pTyr-binding forkhead associated (FHA) protein
MDLKLKVAVGKSAGQELRIPGPKFLIGRGEDCQLRPKSDLISRHHCVLLVDEESVSLRDLGSRNGTFVNDEQLFGEAELHTGDRIKFGPLEFDVVVSVSAPAKKLPAVTSIKEAAERAAGGRATEDVDVASWLGNDAPANGDLETRELRSADTEEIQMGHTISDATVSDQVRAAMAATEMGAGPEVQSDTPSDVVHAGHGPRPKGKPGKLPIGPKKADSREAAADVLRKFFHRK